MFEENPRKIGYYFVGGVLAFLAIFTIIMLIVGTPDLTTDSSSQASGDYTDFEITLIEEAKEIYFQAKKDGLDMVYGPCLSEQLAVDWVVDIVSEPRESWDNDPLNQCTAFREGRAKHFIELDKEGNLIRLK